jgi:acetolactate decarboxylase
VNLRPRAETAIQQFSFVDALVVGLYDGAFDAAAVASAGNLGVGCGDALDGELVLIDGSLFVCRADGVTPVEPTARIPFAEVAHFEPTFSMQLSGPMSEAEFEALVDSLVPSHNLFYAIRVDGEFASVTVREAVKQQRPFRGLAEAVGDQHESTVTVQTGTLLGFKGPDVFQGLSVADYHLHFIDSARTFGGHSMDFELTSGTLTVEAYANFMLRLPQTASYLDAELDDINADAAIRAAESQ